VQIIPVAVPTAFRGGSHQNRPEDATTDKKDPDRIAPAYLFVGSSKFGLEAATYQKICDKFAMKLIMDTLGGVGT